MLINDACCGQWTHAVVSFYLVFDLLFSSDFFPRFAYVFSANSNGLHFFRKKFMRDWFARRTRRTECIMNAIQWIQWSHVYRLSHFIKWSNQFKAFLLSNKNFSKKHTKIEEKTQKIDEKNKTNEIDQQNVDGYTGIIHISYSLLPILQR